MRRREFIKLVGGAASWPTITRAQQPGTPVIGFLHGATPDSYASFLAAFRKGLNEAGYIEGQNVTVEYRWADNQLERLPELAAELVRHRVSVIFAGGGSNPSLAAKAATSTIPVVFASGVDPIDVGLVSNLNRPGGNITGITFLINTLAGKQLEVLYQLVPKAAVIAVLLNPQIPTASAQLKDIQTAARILGLQINVLYASTERDFDMVFASLVQAQAGGLVIGADAFLFSHRNQLIRLATHNSVPTVYPWSEAVAAGGLVSYGTNVADAYHLAGGYIGSILKGARPGELPIQQSVRVELILNVKTAKALNLSVPPALLARADEVIE